MEDEFSTKDEPFLGEDEIESAQGTKADNPYSPKRVNSQDNYQYGSRKLIDFKAAMDKKSHFKKSGEKSRVALSFADHVSQDS